MESDTRVKLSEISEILRAKKNLSRILEDEIKALQAEVIEVLDAEESKSFSYTTKDGQRIKATRSQSSKLIFHETGLKKELGAKLWAKVTKRVLDEDRLAEQIGEGAVGADVVAKHSETKLHSPYIRYTVRPPTKG